MSQNTDPLLNILLAHGMQFESIAADLGVAVSDVEQYTSGYPIPRRLRHRLREVVGNWLDFKWCQVGNVLLAFPHLAQNPVFREHLQQLNEAHWIVFGVSVAERTADMARKESK